MSFSEPGDDSAIAADVADAIDHYQQLEGERFADAANQVHDNLDSVAHQVDKPWYTPQDQETF